MTPGASSSPPAGVRSCPASHAAAGRSDRASRGRPARARPRRARRRSGSRPSRPTASCRGRPPSAREPRQELAALVVGDPVGGRLAHHELLDLAPVLSRTMRTWSSSSFLSRATSLSSIWRERSSLVTPLREKTRASITVPSTPGGTLSEVSRTSPAFSPKIARSSFSSGESWVSPFGVILPTRMSPGTDLGSDADDPRLVEVHQRLFADVRNVARDVLGPSLVSRATHSNSSMCTEVKRSSFTTRSLIRIESSKL